MLQINCDKDFLFDIVYLLHFLISHFQTKLIQNLILFHCFYFLKKQISLYWILLISYFYA